MNNELKAITKSLKEIESCQKSMSKSLYFIAKAINKQYTDPYQNMPKLLPEDTTGKFVCYHEEDDSIYIYLDGLFCNRYKFNYYVAKCAEDGNIYQASLSREDYKKR